LLLGCIWFVQKIHLPKKLIEKERGTNLRVVLKGKLQRRPLYLRLVAKTSTPIIFSNSEISALMGLITTLRKSLISSLHKAVFLIN
jgi:hypothetical protein